MEFSGPLSELYIQIGSINPVLHTPGVKQMVNLRHSLVVLVPHFRPRHTPRRALLQRHSLVVSDPGALDAPAQQGSR